MLKTLNKNTKILLMKRSENEINIVLTKKDRSHGSDLDIL
jgi:hypothetical protein